MQDLSPIRDDELMPIEALPQSLVGTSSLPYAEWEQRIRPGMMVDWTDRLNGMQPKNFQSTIILSHKRGRTVLKCVIRKGRTYLIHPKEQA